MAAERIAGVEIDDCAERAFVERGLGGLVDHDRREQLGGEDVEIEGAVAIGGGAVAGRGDRLHAVDADAGELRAEAAHGDGAAFAGVALDGDARDALQRFGEILVGEAGDVLGDDGIDRGDQFALEVERGVQRGAEAGDDDVGLGRVGRGSLRLRGGVGSRLGGRVGRLRRDIGGRLGFGPRGGGRRAQRQDRGRAEQAGDADLASVQLRHVSSFQT